MRPQLRSAVCAFVLSLGGACAEPIAAPPVERIDQALAHTAVVSGSTPATYTFEIPKNVAVQFTLEGQGGSSADSLEAIILGPVAELELGRVRTAGLADASAPDRVLIGAFPTRVRVRVVVRGVRPSDQGEFVLQAAAASTGNEPEHAPDTLLIGQPHLELLDHPTDVDRFRITVTAGDRVLLFIGRSGAPQPYPLSVTVTTSVGTNVHFSTHSRGDHAPWERSVVLEPVVTTTYFVTITAPPEALSNWDHGAYTLLPVRVLRTPESAASMTVRGDTIHEAIDEVGDIDRFTLAASVREDFRVALALERPVAQPVRVRVLRDGIVLDSLIVSDSTSDLRRFRGRRIFSEVLNSYVVEVSSALQGGRPALLTPYRLHIVHETRDPEVASERLSAGVPVVTEAIDETDDIDEYRFVMAPGQRFSARTVGEVRTFLLNNNDVLLGEIVGDVVYPPGFRSTASAGIAPAADDYKVRVVGRAPGVQPYSLTFFTFDTLPETVPTLLPANTWITSEGLEAPGDVDVFEYVVGPGAEYARVRLQRGDVADGVIVFQQNVAPIYGNADLLDHADPLRRHAAGTRLPLRLSGVTWTADGTASGRYRLIMDVPDVRPETAPQALALGDTVSGETIESTTDIDEFHFTGTPGQSVDVWFDGPVPICGYSEVMQLETFDGATRLTFQTPGFPETKTRTTTIPASGLLALVVRSVLPSPEHCFIGPYRLAVTATP